MASPAPPKKPVLPEGCAAPSRPPTEVEQALQAAEDQLLAGDPTAAAHILQNLLRGEYLVPGYPLRQLVSAAQGLVVFLPDPHVELAQECLHRARTLLDSQEPGQTRLW